MNALVGLRRFFSRALCIGAVMFWSFAPTTHASDYGCKVLLCLSNPNGPTAVSECRPPIERLWDDLHHGRPFPSCEEGSPAVAKLGLSYYDPCPTGTTALPVGAQATLSVAMPPAQPPVPPTTVITLPNGAQATVPALPVAYQAPMVNVAYGQLYSGIGEGGSPPTSGGGDGGGDSGYVAGQKVCVGNLVGSYVTGNGGDSGSYYTVGQYDSILLIDPPTSIRAIDVYIGDLWYRRVRW